MNHTLTLHRYGVAMYVNMYVTYVYVHVVFSQIKIILVGIFCYCEAEFPLMQ